MRLLPGIAPRTRPETLFVRGEALHLGFELVPETAAACLCGVLEVLQSSAVAVDVQEILGDMVFSIQICGGSGDSSSYGE